MLRLKSLTLENFGPYKGRQTVTFPDGGGVVMFFGENMRGKTTLLNAIRFALFGAIVGRGQRQGSVHLTGNWEADTPGFEVQLELTYNDRKYRLTRTCRPRAGVGTPSRDEDYEVSYYLERDGHILGPTDAADELARIMPKDIMRFFLFDGELLQEYEDLLHTESALGIKISQAIEQILGLPVLTGARGTAQVVRERSESRQALAAQADQKTRQYGTELQGLQANAQILASDQNRYETELANQRARKTAIEEDLRKRERLAALFDRRILRRNDLKDYRDREGLQRTQVGEVMSGAWAAALQAPMAAALERLRREEVDLQILVTRTQVLKDLAEAHAAACPTCLQGVDDAARANIRRVLDEQGGGAGEGEQRNLAALRRRIDALDRGLISAQPEVVRLRWDALEQTRRDIYEAETEVETLTQQIQKGDEQDLRGLRLEYEQVIRDISILDEGLRATREALAENTHLRERLQQRLERLGGGQSAAAIGERALAAELHALLAEGVTVFRDQLKRRVQADATKHFLRLTTEPDYAGLRINDAYGLTIVHKDGSEIPVRSAGAEHVVALSLVAALQNNAPMRGPIVVDSPFGRLDGEHRRRIMAALPEMASQIILLVYEDEMPPAQARPALKDKLLAEYTLVRRGAKHTELQPRREPETA